jgi:hypothetical protein
MHRELHLLRALREIARLSAGNPWARRVPARPQLPETALRAPWEWSFCPAAVMGPGVDYVASAGRVGPTWIDRLTAAVAPAQVNASASERERANPPNQD